MAELVPIGAGARGRDTPKKLSEIVYDAILAGIIAGRYSEGSKLPSETVLAREFAVSRPVVREALAVLRDDGLIRSRQGAGSFVSRRPKDTMLRFAPIGSIADIQRCFEYRAAVEPVAAALAAERWDNEDLELLRTALETLQRAVADGVVGEDADLAFHKAIALASGNQYFVATLESLGEPIRTAMFLNRSLSLLDPAERLLRVQAEHIEVYDAIVSRKADVAHDAMLRHIEAARRRVFEGGDET